MTASPLDGAATPTGRGRVHVVQRTPRYLRTRIVGRFDLRLANELIALLEDWSAKRTGLVAFHDASEVSDYDVDARERLATWSRASTHAFDAIHLLVEKRTIAWVVQIIATVTGGKLKTHHSKMSFEAANARHLAR